MARITQSGGWKYKSRVVTDDQSVLAYVKWNPKQRFIEDGATAVTAAQMQVQANLINFTLNAVADATIGTYTGNSGSDDQVVFADAATVQVLLDLINGLELGIDRYIAGLGDFRPGFAIGTGDGLAVALTNILLGETHKGLEVFADSSGLGTANTMSVGCGTSGAKAGAGQEFPDVKQFEYTSTTAGVITKVRNPNLSRERTYTSRLEVRVVHVHFAAAYASNAKQLDFYDSSNNLLRRTVIGSADVLPDADRYNFDNPIVSAVGPVFVEGVGSGALTDGPLVVGWYERVA